MARFLRNVAVDRAVASPFSPPKAASSPLRTETALRTVPVFRSASSICAPNQSFGLLRCSAWLILRQQSTGLFPPKRSCFRAAPLRRSGHRTVYSETLDLQGFAPLGKPSRGALRKRESGLCASSFLLQATDEAPVTAPQPRPQGITSYAVLTPPFCMVNVHCSA